MKDKTSPASARLLPFGVLALGLLLWAACSRLGLFPPSAFPAPQAVAIGLFEEIQSGRLIDNLIASLFRVTAGFLLAAVLGVLLGLWLGTKVLPRMALLPAINFFRNLSPLAWIPFAILWFGIGDAPAIFLIFMACFFPVVVATVAAIASVPAVHFRVAHDYGFTRREFITKVTIPAISPQLITTFRVTAGLAWLVVVAAEMIAGRDGLGFAIWDARNGLRSDLLVAGMIVIGLIGVIIDRVLLRLTLIPSVRWGYER